MYNPDKFYIVPASGAKRREIVFANEIFGRFFHRHQIQLGLNVPS
jgi:hypothetical protein